MRLPVCSADLDSDVLCPDCQKKLNSRQITQFDIDFSKWIFTRWEQFPSIEDLTLFRAMNIPGKLILVVNKKGRDILSSLPDLIDELKTAYGEVILLERPSNLRKLVRELIHPAIETGVNSLYLPDGSRQNVVMLRIEDKPKIAYSLEDLRQIVTAVMEEQVIFQFQEEGIAKKPKTPSDDFEQKMKDFTRRQARR